ncbi:hypothetical protein Z517_06178 [Fonsecaea pedrosoi CBS 271.37]|uniref:Uncharacterized protein n=1 Tax=Fonsecaea pedrosoi CBS 271.37 TaxID=1442368 RepID=A0A0D2DP96_9EURO|nr:uncharacterized protein Z517_06178 [Fonsecaea pedrosoi CBS 271.37]KIW79566.1 hypothetical protein Z517_06178 [Fonsecaea pedrosoi CBS 271.37]
MRGPSVSSVSDSSTTATSISSGVTWTSTACVAFGVPDPVACPGGALDPSGNSGTSSIASASSSLSETTSVDSSLDPTPSDLPSSTSTSTSTSSTGGTIFSVSSTDIAPAQTSASITASSSATNSTLPAPWIGHPQGRGHGHRNAMIVFPLIVGILIFLLMAIFLWRHYHPSSFHKVLDSIPGFGCFARWRKTREKNRQTRAIHRLGILTGDNGRFGGSGSVADDTYNRHLKKFEEDSARAKGKYSSDAGPHAPGSPFSTGNKSTKSGDTPRTPKLGSPWRYTPTKAGNSGRNNETDSLQSWEEAWFAMGSIAGAARERGEGEEGAGGQGWRKLG